MPAASPHPGPDAPASPPPDADWKTVNAYREALLERSRERVPLDWAMTQNNLGIALAQLGDREANPTRYAQAASAFGDALSGYRESKTGWTLKPIEDHLRLVQKRRKQLKHKQGLRGKLWVKTSTL